MKKIVKREYVFIYDTKHIKSINYGFCAVDDDAAVAFCDWKFADGIVGKLYEYDTNYKPGRLVCEHVCRHEDQVL